MLGPNEKLFVIPEGIETRWASPENYGAGRGVGGQTRGGRKGSACFPLKAGEQKVLAEATDKDERIVLLQHATGAISHRPRHGTSMTVQAPPPAGPSRSSSRSTSLPPRRWQESPVQGRTRRRPCVR